ncbi:MAG: type IV secretory system conjugative DNA transfer family protein [Sneathiella sp.]
MIRFLMLICMIGLHVSILFLWNKANGFNPLQKDWWLWLIETVRVTGSLPHEMLVPMIACGSVSVAILFFLVYLNNRAGAETRHGKHDSKTLHGSARWAERKDIKKTGLLGKKGAVVGGLKKANSTRILRHDGPEHILSFAPTRSGKGVSLVIPTLLSWEESALILDIKGENYALTAGWRQSIGQRVLRFDPASLEGSARYNPLEEVRTGTDYEIADCQNIASMVIDPDGKGLKDYWTQSGWEWLAASILHVLYYVNFNEGRTATLADVHRFMSIGHDGELTDEDGDEGFDRLCDEMAAFNHKRAIVDDEILRAAGAMKKKASNERSGVHSSAKVQLALYSDPIVARNISKCDFRIRDLMNAEEPTSLYIVIPPSDIDRLKPLVRILLNQFLTRLTSEMAFENGKAVKHYKHRLLLMLDEFTSIGKLEIFERALAFMAGYGLKAFIIVQDLTQLQKAYSREEAITSNCHIRIAYAPNKIETAKLLSDMAGKTTLVQKKKSSSFSSSKIGSNTSTSINEVARPLLTPDECMELPGLQTVTGLFGTSVKPGDMLIFVAGHPTIYGQQYLYFQDRELLKRARLVPATSLPGPENGNASAPLTKALDQDGHQSGQSNTQSQPTQPVQEFPYEYPSSD